MAEVWTYTAATNTAVVTGGTSGTPSTFAGFVTADLAGTFDLFADRTIVAVDGAPVAVTNALRPTNEYVMGGAKNDLSIIVTAWTTMVTATIKIVGTDGAGAAINENIIVTGNGTYNATLLYHTIVSTQVTVWTGTTSFKYKLQQGKWGVIWNLGNGQYFIGCNITFGDGATSTYFSSQSEEVTFGSNLTPQTTANNTLKIGTFVTGGASSHGSAWYLITGGGSTINLFGTVLAYGWKVYNTGTGHSWRVRDAAHEYIDCTFEGHYQFILEAPPTYFSRVSCVSGSNLGVKAYANAASVSLSGLVATNTPIGLQIQSNADARIVTVVGLTIINATNHINPFNMPASRVAHIINSDATVDWTTILHTGTTGGSTFREYYCDINVCDPSGAPLSGVVVDCEDATATPVWAAGSVTTDASGNIAQQTIKYKRYYYAGANQVDTYSPHKFTLSKAGYQTLVLENITVDHPLVWHLELQTPSGGGDAIILG